ncbi:MAG: efflux RND transporter periplasmic adaptor subunit [Sphingomonadales bacterium]
MNKRSVIAAALLMVGIGAGYGLSQWSGDAQDQRQDQGREKKILYWVAPMDPNYRSDQPGKSPMGMDLIPVHEGGLPGGDDKSVLRISPAVINNIGVRTARVSRDTLSRAIETVGFIAPDDDKTSHVHVRVDGWIERLLVKTEGERVRKGDLIFEMYSPTLVNAEAEYLQALRIGRKGLTDAAAERLAALGMTGAQIDTLTASRKVERLTEVRAPQDGYVTKLSVGEGMFIEPGTTVFSLADLSSIWVMVDIFEDQAGWVEEGQSAVMTLPFVPGRTWQGAVDYVYPTVRPESRTVRVRLAFANADQTLKPNMYAEVQLSAAPRGNLLNIPREALIRTGRSERVILALDDGRFRPAKVVSGIESGDRIEILSGLREGERIVTSGQFLLDSEASLAGTFLRMGAGGETEQPAAPTPPITGMGTVNSVMAGHGMVNLTHNAIEALDWSAMTMDFRVEHSVDLGGIAVGDHVSFALKADPEGGYVISAIEKMRH